MDLSASVNVSWGAKVKSDKQESIPKCERFKIQYIVRTVAVVAEKQYISTK